MSGTDAYSQRMQTLRWAPGEWPMPPPIPAAAPAAPFCPPPAGEPPPRTAQPPAVKLDAGHAFPGMPIWTSQSFRSGIEAALADPAYAGSFTAVWWLQEYCKARPESVPFSRALHAVVTTRGSPYVFVFGGRVVADRVIAERWQPCVDAVSAELAAGEVAYPALRERLVPMSMSETDLRCILATSAIGPMEARVPQEPGGEGMWDLMTFRPAA